MPAKKSRHEGRADSGLLDEMNLSQLREHISEGLHNLARKKGLRRDDLSADFSLALREAANYLPMESQAGNVRVLSSLSADSFNSLNRFLQCLPNIHLIEGLRTFADMKQGNELSFTSDIPALIRKSRFPSADDCARELVGKSLRALSGMLIQRGGTLVLSEFRDFKKGEDLNWVNSKSELLDICSQYFVNTHSLMIISDPYRSYNEACARGGIIPSQSSLVAYLAAIRETLQQADQSRVVSLEDIIESKTALLKILSEKLEIHLSKPIKESVLVEEVFECIKTDYLTPTRINNCAPDWSHDLQSDESNELRALIGY